MNCHADMLNDKAFNFSIVLISKILNTLHEIDNGYLSYRKYDLDVWN